MLAFIAKGWYYFLKAYGFRLLIASRLFGFVRLSRVGPCAYYCLSL
jgi:hypothetical protein